MNEKIKSEMSNLTFYFYLIVFLVQSLRKFISFFLNANLF
jgi:hypothetical protein